MIYINNDMMNDYGYIDASGIQKLLEHLGSFLAKYKPDGETLFSEWLDLKCRENNYEPIFWLAMLQKEQSLTENRVEPEAKRLNWALGYGCPETGIRNQNYCGFQKQVSAAMKQFKNYETWEQIAKYPTYKIKLYDSAAYLSKNGLPKYTVAESKEDAKNFLYNPRWEGILNLVAIWTRYYSLCQKLNLIKE